MNGELKAGMLIFKVIEELGIEDSVVTGLRKPIIKSGGESVVDIWFDEEWVLTDFFFYRGINCCLFGGGLSLPYYVRQEDYPRGLLHIQPYEKGLLKLKYNIPPENLVLPECIKGLLSCVK